MSLFQSKQYRKIRIVQPFELVGAVRMIHYHEEIVDLHHTAASSMLNHGIPVIVVSRRLGHARPSITLDVYGHMIPTMQADAAQKIDELITREDVLTAGQPAPNCTRTVPGRA